MSVSSAVSGALGSVMGYVGAEVARPKCFERLLWPGRFYNTIDAKTVILMAFLLPLGGPLHRAALEVLEQFKRNGLLRGMHRGDMLGTAFLVDTKARYVTLIAPAAAEPPSHIRNGLWFQVLKLCKAKHAPAKEWRPDSESQSAQVPLRAIQTILHLSLEYYEDVRICKTPLITVLDGTNTLTSLAGILASELSAITVAISAAACTADFWLSILLCVPLLLKILALMTTVRREPLLMPASSPSATSASGSRCTSWPCVYAIDEKDLPFATLSGPSDIVQQFFRHYGHPLRSAGRRDRLRELSCIGIVYAFVLHFPVGLICLIWMGSTAQYIWLGYQLYTVVVMHITRLAELEDLGSFQERIANCLIASGKVCLVTRPGDQNGIIASLSIADAANVGDARRRTAELRQTLLRTHC